MNNLSRIAVSEVRNEINNSLAITKEFCEKSGFQPTQDDISFFTFFIKKSIFFGDLLNLDTKFNEQLKRQLKADCIDLIRLTIVSDKRPINLTFRSIFENYIRLIEQSDRPLVHYDWKLLDNFIIEHNLTNQTSFFKSLYKKLSTDVHFHNKYTSLTEYISELLKPEPIPPKKRSRLYLEIYKVYIILENCFVQDNPDLFNHVYYRRISIIKILLSKKSEDYIRQHTI
ncbi:hypothetical protein FC71_GL001019 [Latilactobacillus sakei subsp. carnosus DSM 15831]|uniref:hypothetical protein n=1 Tax=Latilactobacillus sakei TaxID=1599 RepID=UPI00019CF8A0|nr:hypothetical protein [Latilactobacillus sakei]KRL69582.1 hypothetical protein FC71_GL001019 [Latilactobacillus sakei subsp. carnosus DSM 15831]MCP8855200.1 hypothetical protein [Latilactobacillus sakei]GEP21149.1 hypothetical protein LSA03nite_07370 [Latilactobacillus sakei subsp. carnosus]